MMTQTRNINKIVIQGIIIEIESTQDVIKT